MKYLFSSQNQFGLQVRIWNYKPDSARDLVDRLNESSTRREFVHCHSGEECAREADVIVTATNAPTPIVKLSWLKQGVHINGR